MIDLPSQPLDQEWEKAAAKSLIDILSWLAHGSFVSADDFCERLRSEHDAIKIVYGTPINYQEQHRQWRANLEAWEQENKVVPLKPELEEPDPNDPNYS
jgi:hypothetical protein